MKKKINIVDVGARYGIHPNFRELENTANYYLYEIDEKECARLKKKYKKNKNIKIINQGLYSKKTVLKFNLRNHRGLNSIYSTNDSFLNENKYKKNQFKELDKKKVLFDTLDNTLGNKKIDFLKLDVEGAELEVLKGGEKQIKNNVLGIRSEVTFSSVYKNAPMFGEINDYLINKDFEFINFDYAGRGNKFGKYSLPGKYGQLITTDAVWIKKISTISKKDYVANLISISAFLFLNNAEDLAVDLLLDYTKKSKKNLKKLSKDPIIRFIKNKILVLFKTLSNSPYFSETEINTDFKNLFGESFPKYHNFYQNNF